MVKQANEPADLLLPDLELSDALASQPFTERHHRIVSHPVDHVWDACLTVTAKEIRLLGPLMTLRTIPRLIRHGRAITVSTPEPLLDAFMAEGFVMLRQDEEPTDGRAVLLFGAAGTFWSVSENAPLPFATAQEFLDFDEPGYAKTVARLEAIALDDGRTRVETETWVAGTDRASTTKFAPYWAIIRGPSGLIRRSWLAAIERRASRLADRHQAQR